MINIEDFDLSLPKIDKNLCKNIGIYSIGLMYPKLMIMKIFIV